MRLVIVAVGRLRGDAERALMSRYQERLDPLGRSLGIGPLTVFETNPGKRSASRDRQNDEAAALLAKVPDHAHLIAMDERGKTRSSEEFARHIAALRDDGIRDLVLAIGGADGHQTDLLTAAKERLSLGPMTLPHELARCILAEQLYRAVTILAKHPYHRE